MTLREVYTEIFKELNAAKIQNEDFCKEIADELIGPTNAENVMIKTNFTCGLDIGIRIGIKYKEMQQKEIEKEIKV